MLERHIQFIRVERPAAEESAAGARVRLADKFPRTALRRMTHLGLLTGAVLDGVALGPEDAVVYASSFAETRALEDYLTSFPTASPLLFQTSIHPSAVQQVLIGRQQPIRRFWPMTGRQRLVESALLTALLEPSPRIVLTGGEERGSWMLEQKMASDQAFAFGLVLTTESTGATGKVSFDPARNADEGPCPGLLDFADALAGRTTRHWNGAGGAWRVEFS